MTISAFDEGRFMKVVHIQGEAYRCHPMSPDDVRVGALVRWRENRSAYRIIAFDAGDAVLRDLRRPHLFAAEPISSLPDDCWHLEPVG